MDAVKLELARQDAANQHVGNVVFREADVTQLDERETYDFVYARFLLTPLRSPELMVARQVAALQPGEC